MDSLSLLLEGFAAAITPGHLLWALLGVTIGTAVGVLPGIGPALTVALLLPITFRLEPSAALILFAGIYYGGMYGGSTTGVVQRVWSAGVDADRKPLHRQCDVARAQSADGQGVGPAVDHSRVRHLCRRPGVRHARHLRPQQARDKSRSQLSLIGDLVSTLMPTRRFRIIIQVIKLVLNFLLRLCRLRGVLRCEGRIVGRFHTHHPGVQRYYHVFRVSRHPSG